MSVRTLSARTLSARTLSTRTGHSAQTLAARTLSAHALSTRSGLSARILSVRTHRRIVEISAARYEQQRRGFPPGRFPPGGAFPPGRFPPGRTARLWRFPQSGGMRSDREGKARTEPNLRFVVQRALQNLTFTYNSCSNTL